MKYRKLNITLLIILIIILGMKIKDSIPNEIKEKTQNEVKEKRNSYIEDEGVAIKEHYLIIYNNKKEFSERKLKKVKDLEIEYKYKVNQEIFVAVTVLENETDFESVGKNGKKLKDIKGVSEVKLNYADPYTIIFKEGVTKERKVEIFNEYIYDFQKRIDEENKIININDKDTKFIISLKHYDAEKLRKEKEIKNVFERDNQDYEERKTLHKEVFIIEK